MLFQETKSFVDVEKNGTAIFKENCFFYTVKQVVVESFSESDLISVSDILENIDDIINKSNKIIVEEILIYSLKLSYREEILH